MSDLRRKLLSGIGLSTLAFAMSTAIGFGTQNTYYNKFSEEEAKTKAYEKIKEYQNSNFIKKTYHFGNYLRSKIEIED